MTGNLLFYLHLGFCCQLKSDISNSLTLGVWVLGSSVDAAGGRGGRGHGWHQAAPARPF